MKCHYIPSCQNVLIFVSRSFRAPELLLGSNNYNYKVDIWSAAIVLSEMCLGRPIFYTRRGGLKEHMEIIFSYLGLPTAEDYRDMMVDPLLSPPKKLEILSMEERFDRHEMGCKDEFLALIKK